MADCDCGACFRCANPEWQPTPAPEPDPDRARDEKREREDERD